MHEQDLLATGTLVGSLAQVGCEWSLDSQAATAAGIK